MKIDDEVRVKDTCRDEDLRGLEGTVSEIRQNVIYVRFKSAGPTFKGAGFTFKGAWIDRSQLEPLNSAPGRKDDTGKPRWSLIPPRVLGEVLGVLEFGAKRYGVDNWKNVPNSRTRYYDAAMRHITAWWEGEDKDPDSGMPHLAHAICCLVFLSAGSD